MFSFKKEFKVLLLLFLIFLFFYLIFIPGNVGSDGYEIYLTAKNLVLNGKLWINDADLTPDLKLRYYLNKHDNHHYSGYGLFSSLMLTPFYLAGLFAVKILKLNMDPDVVIKLFVNFSNCFFTAFIIALMYFLARIFNYSVRVSAAISLMLGFTTMIWNYSKESFSEPLATLLIMLSVIFVILYNKHGLKNIYLFWSAFFFGLSVLCKIYNVVFIIPIFAYLALIHLKNKDSRAINKAIFTIIITGLSFLIIAIIINKIKFGAYMHFGYAQAGGKQKIGFNLMAFISGVYGYFLSSGKSIFLYSPVLILSLFALPDFYRKFRNEFIMFAVFLITALLLFAPIKFWFGGVCWGPRYLYALIPLMMLPMGEVLSGDKFKFIKNKILPILIILGVLIQIPSVMVGYFYWDDIMRKSGVDEEQECFVPKYSPFAGSWLIFGSAVNRLLNNKSSQITVENGKITSKIDLSEYDQISPCWMRALQGKIVKYDKEVLIVGFKQRILIAVWLTFLIAAVAFGLKKLYNLLDNSENKFYKIC